MVSHVIMTGTVHLLQHNTYHFDFTAAACACYILQNGFAAVSAHKNKDTENQQGQALLLAEYDIKNTENYKRISRIVSEHKHQDAGNKHGDKKENSHFLGTRHSVFQHQCDHEQEKCREEDIFGHTQCQYRMNGKQGKNGGRKPAWPFFSGKAA